MPLKPNICRVCLSRNHPMTLLCKTRYREFYEQHTGNRLITGNGRPDKVCNECNTELKNFFKFLQLSKKTEKYISKTYKCGAQLLQEKLDELAKDLESMSEPTADYNTRATDQEMQDFSCTPTRVMDDDMQEAVITINDDVIQDAAVTPRNVYDVIVPKKNTCGVAVKIEALEYNEIELVIDTDSEGDSDEPCVKPSRAPINKTKPKWTYVMKDHNYSRNALEVSITDNNDKLQETDDSIVEDDEQNVKTKKLELSNVEEMDQEDSLIGDFAEQTHTDSNQSFELSDVVQKRSRQPIKPSTRKNDKNEGVISNVDLEKPRSPYEISTNDKNKVVTSDVDFEESTSLSELSTNENDKCKEDTFDAEFEESISTCTTEETFDLESDKQAHVESRRPLQSITEENVKDYPASVTDVINKLPKVRVELERIPITRHLRSAKKKVKKPQHQMFYCHECSYKCQFKSIMEKHSKIHRSHKPTKSRKPPAKGHSKPDRLALQKRGECDKCGKIFKKQLYLNRHKKLHLKMYECDVCGRQFHHKSTYLVHTRTHTGERPFGCKWCDKTFNDKSNCRKHMKTHTGTTKYPCMMCSRVFSQKSRLKRHAVDHIL